MGVTRARLKYPFPLTFPGVSGDSERELTHFSQATVFFHIFH